MSASLTDLDTKRYGRLLAKALPAVVKSEAENDRMLAIRRRPDGEGRGQPDGVRKRAVGFAGGLWSRKRRFGKEHAKKLAAFFHVGVQLFI
jgi:hypothetical protein